MIEIVSWTNALAEKLVPLFGPRLRFLGYQGSYGRGEAREDSDIDIVAVLDALSAEDLEVYRRAVGEMPRGHLACGFICGERELYAWPKYDSLGLLLDTKPVVGDLKSLLPSFTKLDSQEALAIGAAGLYHAACHSYLYNSNRKDALPGLAKAAFFCLRFWALCRDGRYYPSKRELETVLAGREKELLRLSVEPERTAGFGSEEVGAAYALLMDWCGDVLRNGREAAR